ncbi:hypothetical protein QE152_g19151 [Popillia japonica]|uniref:Uncharacterized protein n=1 Tax=Popillia japonica TaxID=7064 RepID=A0AAW1L3D1_POPJA
MEEAEKIMNGAESDTDGPIDIVQLPPSNVDDVTDEEELDDNELEEDVPNDVAGELELHVHNSCNDSEMNNNEEPDNVSNNNTSGESSVIGNKKRKRLSRDHVLPSWKKVNPNYTRSYPTSENKTKDDLILLTKN